ncbi:MAG: hypothetical protein M0C28_21970 [Candidatus Moduliflexus flocculans]|nr:hypothetical protein [Candidatus Moduliflexus flocculans]
MDMRVVVEAPAKVNLHLQVLGKRPDGFHDLLSLFQAVSLCDTLDIRTGLPGRSGFPGSSTARRRRTRSSGPSRAFLDAAGSSAGLDIRVRKRIPRGGGTGGGSSDAAAALKALNLAFGGRLSACARSRIWRFPWGPTCRFSWAAPARSCPGEERSWRPRKPGRITSWSCCSRVPESNRGGLRGGGRRLRSSASRRVERRPGRRSAPGRIPEGVRGSWTFRNDFLRRPGSGERGTPASHARP